MEPSQTNDVEKLVVPWMGIIANIPRWKEDGRFVGRSGLNIKNSLTLQGFKPVRVTPQWNYAGFSGYAVVEFTNDWFGMQNAMDFEKTMEANKHGKKDYHASRDAGDGLYGWMAKAEDYRSREAYAQFLQKKGDLKTVDEVQADDKIKLSCLVSTMTQEIDEKSKSIKKIESKVNETTQAMNKMIAQKEKLHEKYEKDRKNMQDADSSWLKAIFSNHEATLSRLEIEKRKLAAKEEELQRREALNQQEREQLAQRKEREQLARQKEMNERATLEQKIADEKLLKLAEEQKKEKEQLQAQIMEMRKALEAREVLELEIETLKGTIEVKKHMGDEGEEDGEREKLLQIQNELKDKEEELESISETNQALIIKERKTNDELQEARKELIKNLNDSSSRVIGVKRMGDLDIEPFQEALRGHMSSKKKVNHKAAELCSQWSEELRNPHWNPYKMLPIPGTEDFKEIVDPDDEKLSKLKHQLGDVPYEAVATALRELNEYNRSGRYPVLELWSFKESRRATLQEGCSYVIEQWKRFKRRK